MNRELTKENAERIFEEHANKVFRFALFLTKSKESADDITQETFIQVFRKYHTYDPEKPIDPWIYSIALNKTRNMLRKQKWLDFFDRVPERGCADIVESAVLRNEEEKELWRQVNNLSLNSREMIVLHFYSGMKLKEVSEILQIPLGTCKSRLNTALDTLRKKLPQNEFSFLKKGGDLYEPI